MDPLELSELVVAPAVTDADLEALIAVRRLVTPEARPTVENLRFSLESRARLVYIVARLGDEPVACGFVHSWPELAHGDVSVVPAFRRRGIGSAVLTDLSVRAHGFGNDSIQGEIKESDSGSRRFLERRGFVEVGAEKAVALDLRGIDEPDVQPPPGVRIVSRVEEPDLLDGMFAVAVEAHEDIPGSFGAWTLDDWRAREIDQPSRRPELCFIALAGDEVVGYAALDVFGDKAHHGLTATRRDWRRRGVAMALKRAEIAAAKRAGFDRLVTESEERNEPMRRLNERLGFVPAPELSAVTMRGPVG